MVLQSLRYAYILRMLGTNNFVNPATVLSYKTFPYKTFYIQWSFEEWSIYL